VGNWVDMPIGPTGWARKVAKWYEYAVPITIPAEDVRIVINQPTPIVSGATFELSEIEFYGFKAQ